MKKPFRWLKNWFTRQPDSFTTGFSDRRGMKERLQAALDTRAKKRGAAALLALGALALAVGGFIAVVRPGQAVQRQATGTVTVAVSPNADARLVELAQMTFEVRYPEITLEQYPLDTEDLDSAMDRLRTELMAGRGPDVLIDNGTMLPDLYKSIAGGMLADLGPYMEQTDFSPDPFNRDILATGEYEGRQYVMPLAYRLSSMYMSSRQAMEESGFGLGPAADAAALMARCRAMYAADPRYQLTEVLAGWITYGAGSTELYSDARDGEEGRALWLDAQSAWLSELFPDSVDPAAGTFTLSPAARAWLEYTKQLYSAADFSPEAFREGRRLPLLTQLYGEADYYYAKADSMARGQDPASEQQLVTLHNDTGGVTAKVALYGAVAGGSANKLNAWRFLECMLESGPQGSLATAVTQPVRRSNMFQLNRGRKIGSVYSTFAVPDYEAMSDEQRAAMEKGEALPGTAYHNIEVPVDDRYAQELAAAYEAVDHVVLDRGVYDQAFEQLKPYVRGEADLDACLAQAQRAVRFYFDE